MPAPSRTGSVDSFAGVPTPTVSSCSRRIGRVEPVCGRRERRSEVVRSGTPVGGGRPPPRREARTGFARSPVAGAGQRALEEGPRGPAHREGGRAHRAGAGPVPGDGLSVPPRPRRRAGDRARDRAERLRQRLRGIGGRLGVFARDRGRTPGERACRRPSGLTRPLGRGPRRVPLGRTKRRRSMSRAQQRAFVIGAVVALAMTPHHVTRAATAKPPLHGRHWVAITGKPLGATAGALIFAKGGNAVDAACAMLAATTTMWDTL